MKVIYARAPIYPSIFLAGPTPRSSNVASWRPEAIKILEDLRFTGTVYVPEDRDSKTIDFEYIDQIRWEQDALNSSTVIVFWVPRDLQDLPGFTTNVEFGFYVSSGKCIFGAPVTAPNNRYLIELANKFNVPIYNDLRETLSEAVLRTNKDLTNF